MGDGRHDRTLRLLPRIVVSDLNPADLAALEQADSAADALDANRRAVLAKAEAAFVDLAKILAATDAQLDAQRLAAIRTLAKTQRGILRLLLDRYEGTD